jgi:hypothetical protein
LALIQQLDFFQKQFIYVSDAQDAGTGIFYGHLANAVPDKRNPVDQ